MKKKLLINIFFLIFILIKSNFAYEEKSLLIDSEKIFYITDGQNNKTPLLILHGLGMSSTFWKNNIKELAGNRKVYAIDLPGFGYSDTSKSDVTINYYVDFIRKFLSEQKISKVILLGHSFSGAIASIYSLKYPSEVEKLILVNSSGIGTYGENTFFQLLKMPIIGDVLSIMRDKDMIKEKLRKDFFYNSNFVTDDLINAFGHSSRNIVLSVLRSFPDISDEVAKIKSPVLIIWGENDKIYSVINAHVFNEKIPNSILIILSECGACPQIEKSYNFNEVVKSFLN